MSYWKSILELLKDILKAFLEVNLSILNDLKSFRNKLVFFTCLLVFIICVQNQDYRVSLGGLGLLEFFLCYYFNNRKVKDATKSATIIKNIVKKTK